MAKTLIIQILYLNDTKLGICKFAERKL